MTLLTQVAGLPLSINDEAEDLHYSHEEVHCGNCGTVCLKDISASLLNKALMYPENVYKYHKEVKLHAHSSPWPGNYIYDVIYLPDGLLGIEYIKTHIFFGSSTDLVACVIQVFSGTLTVLMQKNREKQSIYDFESHVEEAVVIEVESGEKLAIPAGYYYTFVNTSSEPVAFARVTREEHQADYAALRRESGLAYYLISKNARQEVVLNPRYRTVPELKNMSPRDLNSRVDYKEDLDVPLYDEAVQGAEVLVALFGSR